MIKMVLVFMVMFGVFLAGWYTKKLIFSKSRGCDSVDRLDKVIRKLLKDAERVNSRINKVKKEDRNEQNGDRC